MVCLSRTISSSKLFGEEVEVGVGELVLTEDEGERAISASESKREKYELISKNLSIKSFGRLISFRYS